MTGYCPQQDSLYDLLTCYEHLELYAILKGIPKKIIQTKVNDMLAKVGLDDSKNTLVVNLITSKKRILCIAIALIGDPKVSFR